MSIYNGKITFEKLLFQGNAKDIFYPKPSERRFRHNLKELSSKVKGRRVKTKCSTVSRVRKAKDSKGHHSLHSVVRSNTNSHNKNRDMLQLTRFEKFFP